MARTTTCTLWTSTRPNSRSKQMVNALKLASSMRIPKAAFTEVRRKP